LGGRELYRLSQSTVTQVGLAGPQATFETKAAFDFANKAIDFLK
jgi:hypothetical protein